jgi:hypothetical protein
MRYRDCQGNNRIITSVPGPAIASHGLAFYPTQAGASGCSGQKGALLRRLTSAHEPKGTGRWTREFCGTRATDFAR